MQNIVIKEVLKNGIEQNQQTGKKGQSESTETQIGA